MRNYPIHSIIDELKASLKQNQRLILQAPPGAGKTTMVPLALLDQPWLDGKQIIILEPRRLATRSAAARMAELLGEKVGETVGYQIRQDIKASTKTRILVVTEGILTRKLQSDPQLQGVGLVIFDEFHERSVHADLALALCLQSQEILNESLKILLMSATLNTRLLSDKLNNEAFKAPTLCSEGRSFPVELIYRKPHLADIDHKNLVNSLYQQTLNALSEHTGNILIFLPGVGEIRRLTQALAEHLQNSCQDNIILAPLYGDLNKAQQDQAIAPPPAGQRKIVLATNIAQTSLTIEGINVVIDSGLQRQAHFSPDSGMSGLHTLKIAQDTAQQRSGRAGRLGPGICYRLWTENQHKNRPKHETPEILHADLAPLLLELAQWGVSEMNELVWLDLPSAGHIAQARNLLLRLQAIDHNHKLTSHGKNILSLGLHPRLAHMILTAQQYYSEQFKPTETASLLAALLSEKDIIPYASDREVNHDIAYRISILQTLSGKSLKPRITHQGINKALAQQVLKTARDIQYRLKINVSKETDQYSLDGISQTEFTGILVAFAYPDRIARLRSNNNTHQGARYLLAKGSGASFNQPDQLSSEPYLAIGHLSAGTYGQQKEARIFLAAAIDKTHIERFFANHIQTQDKLLWNAEQQKVEAVSTQYLDHLLLDKQSARHIDPHKAFPVLFKAIKNMGLNCLPWTPTALILKQRVEFINTQKQQNHACQAILNTIELPDFSDENLINHLQDWLQPHLSNETSIKQLQKLDLLNILYAMLSWDMMQQLDQLAPEKIKVPSGSKIRLDYSDPDSPILAVRLQEVFGLQQTPAILKGCYPLLLHLLSPASRPMQVTRDLASFWKNTYNEVKKELRGKYKKHYWPDDPLEAQATSRAKPRKT